MIKIFIILTVLGSSSLANADLISGLLVPIRWNKAQVVEVKRIAERDPLTGDAVFGFSYNVPEVGHATQITEENVDNLRMMISKIDPKKIASSQRHPWIGVHKNVLITNHYDYPMFVIELSKPKQKVVKITQVFQVSKKQGRFSFLGEHAQYLEVDDVKLWNFLNNLTRSESNNTQTKQR